jgi:hypothetical protein
LTVELAVGDDCYTATKPLFIISASSKKLFPKRSDVRSSPSFILLIMTSDDDTLKPCPPVPAEHVVVDEDAPGPPISLPDSADTGEGGKIKMIVQLVRKCLGVKDIAAMYVSSSAESFLSSTFCKLE